MKNTLLPFLLLININLFSQDLEYLNFINIYRVKNNCNTLLISDDLQKIAEKQNNINIITNNVSHSHMSSEIALIGSSLPIIDTSIKNFSYFLDTFFGLKYKEFYSDNELISLTKLYSIYLFSKSKKHNEILLGDYIYIGFNHLITNVKVISNTIKIRDKCLKLNNFNSYYKVDFYFVIDFKK